MPPLTGTAVKVTGVPAQIAPAGDAVIVTDGVSCKFTDIVIVFDVAVTGLAQVALETITQFTVLPLLNVLLVYLMGLM